MRSLTMIETLFTKERLMRAMGLALITAGLSACVSGNNPTGEGGVREASIVSFSGGTTSDRGLETPGTPGGSQSSVDPNVGGSAPIAQVCSVDRFRQNEEEPRSKVDILFVMDTSGSMGDDWERVALNIQSMVKEIPADTDIRYGVILGHAGAMQGKLYSGSGIRVLSNQSLTSDQIAAQLFDTFQKGMKVADETSGEATFHSLYYSVTKQLVANQAQGFFRPDAALATIFVSDENEIGMPFPTVQPAGLPARCDTAFENGIKTKYYDRLGITLDSVYSAVKAAKGDMPWGAHAVVNVTAEDLFVKNSRTAKCHYDSLGYGFFDIVAKTGGTLNSLQQDTSKALAKIGAAVRKDITLMHEFRLSKSGDRVDPKTIVAKVDGVMTRYLYDMNLATVKLESAGRPGSQIEIAHCEPAKVASPVDPAPTPAPAPVPSPEPAPAPQQWQVAGFDGTTAADQANLIWQTQSIPTKAKLFVGLTPQNLSARVTSINEYKSIHYVTEQGLEPNTRYYFKVIGVDQNGRQVESNVISKVTKQ